MQNLTTIYLLIFERKNMKILKVLENTELVIVDLEVNLGNEKRSGLTLCVKYQGEYYPLNTAHDGRPILMNKENIIKNKS
tara:strand:+ start:1674 stop:1913 length:240 start_codon:yes stop_codon:yes gene_type:complete